jgi:hypothetical protein
MQYSKRLLLILTLILVTATVACSQATPEATPEPTVEPTLETEAPVDEEPADEAPVEDETPDEAPEEETVEPTPEVEATDENGATAEETPEVTPEEEASAENGTTVYNNPTYGYSLNVPAGYETLEYTAEIVAVGTPIEDGFDAVANVEVMTPFEDVGEQTFEEFVFNRAMNLCAADGPGMSISCTAVESTEPFETVAGQQGTLFYLTEEQRNLETDEVQTGSKGPFIALDISEQLPEESYAALLIYPAIPLAPDEVDAGLLRNMASSVEFAPEA